MNFDFGNLFTRAGQVTWKHKTIWALVVLPMLPLFLLFPLFLAPILLLDQSGQAQIPDALARVIVLGSFLFFSVFIIGTYALGTISRSAATLGIVRLERGEGSLKFMDLLRDGLKYFGRMLRVMLIISLGIGLLFFVFFMLVFVLSIVTLGLAVICLQPVMILLTPLMFILIGVIEGAETAVIAEELGAMDAVKRAMQVVRAHVWKYAIITLIVYFGSSFVISLLMFPLMIPIFAVPIVLGSNQDIDPQILVLIPIAFIFLVFPVILVIQSVVGTFMKVCLDLAYLHLTGPAENRAK